ERRDLGIRAERFGANHQLRVAIRARGDQWADQVADRIVRRRHAEEDLPRTGVILVQPTLETVNGFGVGALERLEESHGRCEAFVSDAVMQWETERDEQLPQRQNQAEER